MNVTEAFLLGTCCIVSNWCSDDTWHLGLGLWLQLAVLATYINDELLAVYRYFRSLAVETPFLTARDNLILHFEKVSPLFLKSRCIFDFHHTSVAIS